MKLKRIMASILCFAMVLSTMCFPAFAEETTYDDTKVTSNVTGGTFSFDVSDYVADGYEYDSETGSVVEAAPTETTPEGTITPAYTTTDRFWGEAKANATESLVVELYEGETKIGSSTLNSSVIGNQTDGSTYVTWSLKFNDTSSSWTYEWAEGYPKYDMNPDTVKLIVDGVEVSSNCVQYNAADNLNKIVALAEGFTGGVVAYTSLADAVGNFNGRQVNVLRDVTESFENFNGCTLTTNVEGGVTINNTYDGWINANDFNIGKGVTVIGGGIFYETDGVNTIEGTLKVTDTLYHGYNAKTTVQNGGNIIVEGENASTILRYNTNPEAGLYIYGDGNDETVEFSNSYYIGAYSGTFYAENANIETGYFLLKNSYDDSSYADIAMTLDNSNLTVVGTTDTQDSFIIDDQASLTLKNGSTIEDVRDFSILAGTNLVLSIDEASSISATNMSIADDVPFEAVKNADGTYGVAAAAPAVPEGTLNTAYISASYMNGVPAFNGEATGVVGTESFEVKLYSGETLVGTAALVDNDKVLLNGVAKTITWHAALTDDGDEWWSTTWKNGSLNINAIPDNAELWVDGVMVDDNCEVQLNMMDLKTPVFAAVTDNNGNVKSFVAGTGFLNGTGANAPVYDEAFQTAVNNATEGATIAMLRAGTYKVPTGKSVTITGAVDGVVFDNIGACNMGGANVTFDNVTFDYLPNTTYTGLQHAGDMVYNNCTFNGTVFLYGTSETFNACTFNVEGDAYNVWTYGAKKVEFNGCTFNSTGKSLLIYAEGASIFNDVSVNDCDFVATSFFDGKAAIEMDSSLTSGINLTIDNATTATGFDNGSVSGNSLWNNKKGNADAANNDITVTVNNEVVLKPVVQGLSGTGTEDDPYLINNLEELIWFRDKVDEQASDGSTQFAGKYFKLTADIDLAGINWNPIGSMTGDHGSFKGVFDGNGKTISNLTISDFTENGAGLFARTSDKAEIKNLTLNNVTISSNTNYVGGVVANSFASTKITNVHVTGDVNISGRGYVGGISGHGYVVMDNVSVKANEGSIVTSSFWCCGGILGYGGEGATDIKNAHVENLIVTSAAGGLGAIVGMAEDNDGTQPISGSNLSAKNVDIKTYVGAYGTSYEDYAMGYLYGGNPTSELTGNLTVENVTVVTASGNPASVNDAVAQIGDDIYFNLAEALVAAKDGETVELIANENKVVDMNGAVYGKTVTITGTATVDWSKGNLFVGRGGEGDGTVIFDGANLTSASNSASYGIHVSGREKDTDDKYDGTLIINNSSIELDYLINKGTMTLDNSTLTVKNGFSIGGRPASETESGEDATATLTLNNNSKVIVNNHNGMGLGYEAIGVMNIDATSAFETTQSFLVTAKGTMNIEGTAKIAGTLTNNGSITLADANATLTSSECGSVTAWDNGYNVVYTNGAYTLIKAPSATIAHGLQTIVNGEGRESVIFTLEDIYAENELKIELWSNDTNISTTTYNNDGVESDELTVNIVVANGESGSWTTIWHEAPSVAYIPDQIVVYADTVKVDEMIADEGESVFFERYDSQLALYKALSGVYKAASVSDAEGKVADYYATLAGAVAAAQDGNTITVLADITTNEQITIDNKKVVIDLNEKTFNGAIKPSTGDITVKNGSIINKDSTASAIEVTAGTLVVENVNIESERHAVRIDGAVNATINGGTYKVLVNNDVTSHAVNVSGAANVTINGGTFYGPKGTPNGSAMGGSAINSRDTAVVAINGGTFSGGVNNTLNGVAATNIVVTGGTFDQDPSAYVSVGYAAKANDEGTYSVVSIKPDAYTVTAIADKTEVRYNNGNPDSFTVKYVATGGDVLGAMAQLKYDNTLFICAEDKDGDGVVRMNNPSLTTDADGKTIIKTLNFTVKANPETDTTYKFIAEYVQVVSDYDAAGSGAQDGYVENLIGVDVTVIAQYEVTLPSDESVVGNTYVDKNADYTATINNFDEDKVYTVTYTVGGGEKQTLEVTKDNANGAFVIATVSGDLVISGVTSELNFDLVLLPEAISGYTLVMVKDGVSAGYTYNGEDMFAIARYVGLDEIVANDDREEFVGDILGAESVRAILVYGSVTEEEARAAIAVSENASDTLTVSYDVNRNGKFFYNDAMTAHGCYKDQYTLYENMTKLNWYLSADVNGDFVVDVDDYDETVEAYWDTVPTN